MDCQSFTRPAAVSSSSACCVWLPARRSQQADWEGVKPRDKQREKERKRERAHQQTNILTQYICIYIYIHTHLYPYCIYIYVYTYMYIYIYMYMYIASAGCLLHVSPAGRACFTSARCVDLASAGCLSCCACGAHVIHIREMCAFARLRGSKVYVPARQQVLGICAMPRTRTFA